MRKFTSEERPRPYDDEDDSNSVSYDERKEKLLAFGLDEEEASYEAEFTYSGTTKDGGEFLAGGEIDFSLYLTFPNGRKERRGIYLRPGGPDIDLPVYTDDSPFAVDDPIFNGYVFADFAERLTAEELLSYVDERISGEIEF